MTAGSAHVWAIFGATDQGKSATVKTALAADPPARLLIWDYLNEYGAHARPAHSLGEVADAIRSGASWAVRYVGMAEGLRQLKESDQRKKLVERFDTFCALAFVAGRCTLVVEELQRVTLPGWAPPAWSDCTARGRHRHLRVYGLSQRPASVDKDFFGNANVVRTFRLNYAEDVACMANVLAGAGARGAVRQSIATLAPLHYLERDMRTGITEAGTLQFAPGRKKKSRPG